MSHSDDHAVVLLARPTAPEERHQENNHPHDDQNQGGRLKTVIHEIRVVPIHHVDDSPNRQDHSPRDLLEVIQTVKIPGHANIYLRKTTD